MSREAHVCKAFEVAVYAAELSAAAEPVARFAATPDVLGDRLVEALAVRHCLVAMVRELPRLVEDQDRFAAHCSAAWPAELAGLRERLPSPLVDHACRARSTRAAKGRPWRSRKSTPP
jgi:hypothetical protein